MKKNPFVYGKVLKDADLICPRLKEEKRLLSNISSGQNVYIVGERRVGKSTFIYSALKKFIKDESKSLISVDFRSVASKEDVQKRILLAILKSANELKDWNWFVNLFKSLKPVLTPKENGEVEFSVGSSEIQSYEKLSLSEVFDFLEKFNARKKVVVVFDEFQDILALDSGKAILGEMRAKIQLESDIPYIFAGSARGKMNEIFANPDSSFYKSTENLFLNRFPLDQLSQFCLTQFKLGQRIISAELFSDIYAACHGITGDIFKLCHELWEETNPTDYISPDTLRSCLNLIAERDSSNYQAQVSQLTNIQKKLLRGFVLNEKAEFFSKDFITKNGLKTKGTVKEAFAALYRNQIIYKITDQIEFYDPFLKYWLIKTYSS